MLNTFHGDAHKSRFSNALIIMELRTWTYRGFLVPQRHLEFAKVPISRWPIWGISDLGISSLAPRFLFPAISPKAWRGDPQRISSASST